MCWWPWFSCVFIGFTAIQRFTTTLRVKRPHVLNDTQSRAAKRFSTTLRLQWSGKSTGCSWKAPLALEHFSTAAAKVHATWFACAVYLGVIVVFMACTPIFACLSTTEPSLSSSVEVIGTLHQSLYQVHESAAHMTLAGSLCCPSIFVC